MNFDLRFAPRPALLSAIAAVPLLLTSCGEHASANAAQNPTPPPFAVTVVTLEPHDVPWSTTYLAQTDASRAVEIRSRVQGILVERAFDEGSFVHKGDVLYRIDPRPFQASKKAAEAALAQARANLEQADRTVGRKQQLVASEAVAQRELDDALTAQALANAQVAAAQAELEQASLNLEFSTVTAPLDGRVGKVVREQGTMVDSNLNSLLTTMWRVDPLYVSFRVSERELLTAQQARASGEVESRPDEGVRIEVDLIDGTRYPHEGLINFKSVQVDPATGTAEVRAELPNPEDLLLPGQFVRVRALGLTRRGVLSVPQRAVQMAPQAKYVYVVGVGDKVESRNVELSAWQGSEWVVESGLQAGERVIVDGLQKVRPGAVVQPTELTEPADAAAAASPANSSPAQK